MIEVGRLCVKIAGRDAKGACVVVDVIDDNFVMVDGNVRRRKCNIKHLYPLETVLKIKKGASHSEVEKEFSKIELPVWNKKSKTASERPLKQRKKKEVLEEKPKKEKKEVKEKPAEKEIGLETKAQIPEKKKEKPKEAKKAEKK